MMNAHFINSSSTDLLPQCVPINTKVFKYNIQIVLHGEYYEKNCKNTADMIARNMAVGNAVTR